MSDQSYDVFTSPYRPRTAQAMPASGLVDVRVELDSPAKLLTDQVADHFGMTHIAVLSRLIEWYANQPPEIQNAILLSRELSHGDGPGVGRVILERMAGVTPAPSVAA